MNNTRIASAMAAAVCAAGLSGTSVFAASHSWDIMEVFSNADGTIQFIEMKETNGLNNETNLGGLTITSDATGNVFTFPNNLQAPTAKRNLLLATSGFAELPGAPTPDFTLPDGFFGIDGDTLQYHVYDTYVFGPGELPTDCVHSLDRQGQEQVNSPTNYDGETGSVDCNGGGCDGDLDDDGIVGSTDLIALLGAWGKNPGHPADLDGDDNVGTTDLLVLLGNWGKCE